MDNASIILSFSIITKEGVSLISRRYGSDTATINNDENSQLFGGFFAALKMFSETALHQNFRDVVLGDSKFFVHEIGGYIYVVEISFPEILESGKSERIRETINELIQNVDSMISIFLQTEAGLQSEEISSVIDSLVMEKSIEIEMEIFPNKANEKLKQSLESIDLENDDQIIAEYHGKDLKAEEKKGIWDYIRKIFTKKR